MFLTLFLLEFMEGRDTSIGRVARIAISNAMAHFAEWLSQLGSLWRVYEHLLLLNQGLDLIATPLLVNGVDVRTLVVEDVLICHHRLHVLHIS